MFEDVPLGDEEEAAPLETEELAPVSQADQGQALKKIQRLLLRSTSYLDEGF